MRNELYDTVRLGSSSLAFPVRIPERDDLTTHSVGAEAMSLVLQLRIS